MKFEISTQGQQPLKADPVWFWIVTLSFIFMPLFSLTEIGVYVFYDTFFHLYTTSKMCGPILLWVCPRYNCHLSV